MGSNESKKAQKSIQGKKIAQFFNLYGKITGNQLTDWINSRYAQNFSGETNLYFGEHKKYQYTKKDIGSSLQRAFQGKYIIKNLTYIKVDLQKRILYYSWIVNCPQTVDKSKRFDIHYQSYVVFTQNYQTLKVVHNHKPVVKQQQKKGIKSEMLKGYLNGVLERAEDNMAVANELLGQNWTPDTTAIDKQYYENQKRFRENKNKQDMEYNYWARQQNNRNY